MKREIELKEGKRTKIEGDDSYPVYDKG